MNQVLRMFFSKSSIKTASAGFMNDSVQYLVIKYITAKVHYYLTPQELKMQSQRKHCIKVHTNLSYLGLTTFRFMRRMSSVFRQIIPHLWAPPVSGVILRTYKYHRIINMNQTVNEVVAASVIVAIDSAYSVLIRFLTIRVQHRLGYMPEEVALPYCLRRTYVSLLPWRK